MECSSRGSIAQKTARRQRASRLSSGSVSASTANRVVMHAICPVREARRFALCAHMVTSLQDLCILSILKKQVPPLCVLLPAITHFHLFLMNTGEGYHVVHRACISNCSPLI